jgi:membrane-bound ClpP family serine protease
MKNQKTKNRGHQPDDAEFAVAKENFKYIAAGVCILIIGFLLMTGGKPDSPEVFNPEVFSFRRITLAPIIVVGGFMFIIWAIMGNHKKTDEKLKSLFKIFTKNN